MTRVAIDGSKCQGHARCVTRAPELFDVDDEGISFVLAEEVPPEHADAARQAAEACPERAISLQE
ncbi:ferredoxin [Amycolatopsis sp. K13G38]|uniref:Ferredoxin n=1 Tax=Amycolatopsis acididurans TaxID=2724524 RepID=A0ABX1J7C0_9PSEU|nr:ferredoxin [Amycolatopsis acididurans]NKQ55474.1 ferredoxin [Amycolatopsis acididurans]